MEYKQIHELIKMINKSNISELTIEEGDFRITIKQDYPANANCVPVASPPAQPVPVQQQPVPGPFVVAEAEKPVNHSAAASANLVTIKSPMIGTFYRSPSPDKPIFVNVGDEIKVGQVLCIIEAMKLFNEIESEVNGRLVKVVADDSSPVEYDQPLFLVEPM